MVFNVIEEIHDVVVFGGVLAEGDLRFLFAAVVLVEDQWRYSSCVRLLSYQYRLLHVVLKVLLDFLIS